MADLDKIEKAANIIKDIAENNPEATKELGKTALTLTKAINVALSPIAGIVWGYEKIADYLNKRLVEKLSNVPEENIITPPINIAGPTIEAMRFTGENDELREMFANLLASTMNRKTMPYTHPRYVDIIKNLSQEEAKILKYSFDKWGFTCYFKKILIHYREKENPSLLKSLHAFTNHPKNTKKENGLKYNPQLLENLIQQGIVMPVDNRISLNQFIGFDELILKYPSFKYLLNENITDVNVLIQDYIYSSLGVSFLESVVKTI